MPPVMYMLTAGERTFADGLGSPQQRWDAQILTEDEMDAIYNDVFQMTNNCPHTRKVSRRAVLGGEGMWIFGCLFDIEVLTALSQILLFPSSRTSSSVG